MLFVFRNSRECLFNVLHKQWSILRVQNRKLFTSVCLPLLEAGATVMPALAPVCEALKLCCVPSERRTPLPPSFRTQLSRGVSALLGPAALGPFLGPAWLYLGLRKVCSECLWDDQVCWNPLEPAVCAHLLWKFHSPPGAGRATAGLPSPGSQLTRSPWHSIFYGFILLQQECFPVFCFPT